jgi:hypothetical protein
MVPQIIQFGLLCTPFISQVLTSALIVCLHQYRLF